MLDNSYRFYELNKPRTDCEGLLLWSRVERCHLSIRRSSQAAQAEREHTGKVVGKISMAERLLNFRPFSAIARRAKNAR